MPAGFFNEVTDLGNGDLDVAWFGKVNVTEFPWIQHESHGRIYVEAGSAPEYYFSDSFFGVWWTHEDLYPWIYVFDSIGWVYLIHQLPSQNFWMWVPKL